MRNANNYQKRTGKKLLAWSSIWNLHGSKGLFDVAMNSRSNLNKDLAEIFKTGIKSVTLVVSGIGWSAHSETSVAIFDGADDSYDYVTLSFDDFMNN